jgi:transposase
MQVQRTAEVIVSEIGVDMRRFPTAGHLASWSGMCLGNNESAGKRKSGKTRKGNKWLRMAMIEAGQAAARTTDTALSGRHRRIMPTAVTREQWWPSGTKSWSLPTL